MTGIRFSTPRQGDQRAMFRYHHPGVLVAFVVDNGAPVELMEKKP